MKPNVALGCLESGRTCVQKTAKALLDHNPNPSEHEVRHWLAGNLCRCTGYDKIVRAVLDTAQEMQTA